MCNESNVFILFHFLCGCYGGALVFLGGAGAPASPSLAPPMPKGILGWESGAELLSERRALRSEGNMTAPLPLLLHSAHMICWTLIYNTLFTRKNSSFLASYVITLFLLHCTCALLSSFGFQSDQVFTCPLVRITKGINHPLRSDRNFNPILPIQSDWRVYMWLFYSDCASSPITIGL